jgi:hypothetical protein
MYENPITDRDEGGSAECGLRELTNNETVLVGGGCSEYDPQNPLARGTCPRIPRLIPDPDFWDQLNDFLFHKAVD